MKVSTFRVRSHLSCEMCLAEAESEQPLERGGTEMGAIPRSPAWPRVTHCWLTPALSAGAKLPEEQAGKAEG